MLTWQEERRLDFMECEESFITIKLIWHSYLVLSLDNGVHKTSTDTDLTPLPIDSGRFIVRGAWIDSLIALFSRTIILMEEESAQNIKKN